MLRLALPVVPATAVVTGNLTNGVVVEGHHFAKSSVDDAIPMGLSEIRKQGRTRLLKDEMSIGALRALLSVQKRASRRSIGGAVLRSMVLLRLDFRIASKN